MTHRPLDQYQRRLPRRAGRQSGRVRALGLALGLMWGLLCASPASHASILDESITVDDFGDEPARACYSIYPHVYLTEYYNVLLNQFFYTQPCSNDEEIIWSGAAGPGWRRTFREFGVWIHNAGGTRVCRFYGSVWPGPNSHFFTADPTECAFLQSLPKGPPDQPRWNLESDNAFSVVALDATGTGCSDSRGKVLIRRYYNNGHLTGRTPSHRFVADTPDGKEEMRRAGWVDEGVRFCVSGVYYDYAKPR